MTQEHAPVTKQTLYEMLSQSTEDLQSISRELNVERQRVVSKALDNLRFIERLRTIPSVQCYWDAKNKLQRYIGASDQLERKELEIVILDSTEVLMWDSTGKKADEAILVAKIDRLMVKARKYNSNGDWVDLDLPEIKLDAETLFDLYDGHRPDNLPRGIFLMRLFNLSPSEIVKKFEKGIQNPVGFRHFLDGPG